MPRLPILWSLFALQAVCCAYFGLDLISEAFWPTWAARLGESDLIETLVTIALGLGLVVTGSELRVLMKRQNALEDQVKLASGAFQDVMETWFDTWSLTPAEREVAVLAIKGFSISEMASLRNTRPGTIKAQCAAVYRKADVSGRLQLLSIFLDDLMADHLIKPAHA